MHSGIRWFIAISIGPIIFALSFPFFKNTHHARNKPGYFWALDSGFIDFSYKIENQQESEKPSSKNAVLPEVYVTGQIAMSDVSENIKLVELRKIEGSLTQGTTREPITAGGNQSYLLTINDDGIVTNVKSLNSTGKMIENIITELVVSFQISLPRDDSTDHWEVREEDQNGQYRSSYNKRFDVLSGFLNRQYIRKTFSSEISDDSVERDGYIDIQIEEKTLQSISWDGKLAVTISSIPGGSLSYLKIIKGSFTKEHISPPKFSPEQIQMYSTKAGAGNGLSLLGDEDVERKLLENGLAAKSWDDILNDFSMLDAAGEEFDALRSGALVEQLYAYLKLNPEALPEYEKFLVDDKTGPEGFRYIVGALYQVGTSDCQRVLFNAIKESNLKTGRKQTIIAGLALVKEPTLESIESMRELTSPNHGSLTGSAYLGLGAMVSREKWMATTQQKEVITLLSERLNDAQRLSEQGTIMDALGNTESPLVLEIVKSHKSIGDEKFRRRAISSLSFIKTREVDTYLWSQMVDTSESIRIEASKAMERREIDGDLVGKIMERCKIEPSAMVRASLVRTIWNNRSQHALIHDFMASIANEDLSPEVRKVAKTLLSGGH